MLEIIYKFNISNKLTKTSWNCGQFLYSGILMIGNSMSCSYGEGGLSKGSMKNFQDLLNPIH